MGKAVQGTAEDVGNEVSNLWSGELHAAPPRPDSLLRSQAGVTIPSPVALAEVPARVPSRVVSSRVSRCTLAAASAKVRSIAGCASSGADLVPRVEREGTMRDIPNARLLTRQGEENVSLSLLADRGALVPSVSKEESI